MVQSRNIFTRRSSRLLFLVPLIALPLGCGGPTGPDSPNVLLISIDTLRPDHLGSYGYTRPTSPEMDRLAAAGVVFEDASSPSPWTLPAHASLLTGRYPSRHGLNSHDERLPETIQTLAEVLNDHGYTTAAFVNSHNLSERYGLARGFSDFSYITENVGDTEPSAVEEEAIRWLREKRREPFFLFLHYYDVHSDYTSLPRYEQEFVGPSESATDGTTQQMLQQRHGLITFDDEDARHLVDLYDAGIRQMDDGMGRLLRTLDREGLSENTIVVLTSDHGEEFLEHGGILHGRTQHQELIRIPLIFRGPGLPAGKRVSQMTSLLDVAPTLLALAGAPWPEKLDGADLRPLWSQADPDFPPRLLFAEADHNNEALDVMRAVRHERFTLHFNGISRAWTLFDLQSDPGEQIDILADEAAMGTLLRNRLEEFMTLDVAGDPIEPLSPEDVEKLRSLGYLQ